MKIKDILRAGLCCMAVATVNTACRFQEGDVFDESASLRLDHTNSAIETILCSASNKDEAEAEANSQYGWCIQYFVAGTDDHQYPGYNLYADFYDDGTVTISGNHSYIKNPTGSWTSYTSAWEMIKEEGSVLAFNTWNDVLTPFVDPNTISDEPGVGMYGDQNLVMMTYSNDEMTFRGERHSARSHFIRLDRPATQYVKDVNSLKQLICNTSMPNYYVINGTDTTYMTSLSSGRPKFCERLIDPLVTNYRPCVFTTDGFRTEFKDSIGGDLVDRFVLASDSSALEGVGTNVKIIPLWDTYLTTRTDIWNFDTNAMTEEQKDLFDQINASIPSFNKAWSLKSIGLGTSTGGNKVMGLVLTFYTNTAKSKTNTAGVAITFTRPAYGQQIIAVDESPKTDTNMKSIAKKATNIPELATSFAKTLVGTYDVVPNNYFLPTGATYTAIDGSRTFKVTK